MISITVTPYWFGLGFSFNVGVPCVSALNGYEGKMWGINILMAFIYIQVNYVHVL